MLYEVITIDPECFADLDEQRYPYHGAGLQRGRLATAPRGIAAHPGIGVRDLEQHEIRRRNRERRAVPQRHFAHVLFFKPFCGVTNGRRVGGLLS